LLPWPLYGKNGDRQFLRVAMKSVLHLLVLLSIFATMSIHLHAKDTAAPAAFHEVREFIKQGVADHRAPSVAVAVIRDDKLIWAEGFGLADIEANRAANADSIYLMASVSKPIAATGLMLLLDEGKIDLDKPANDYLPRAKLTARVGDAQDMTVRRLLNHTSGMPVHVNFFRDGIAPPSRDVTISRYGFAHQPPGARYEYCNLAYGIIDYITALQAGATWREFMDVKLYDAVGMTHTSDRVRPGLEGNATAQYRHDLAGRFVRVPDYGFDHDGASAVWSSANDLSRFLRLHLNDGVLDGKRCFREGTLRAMRQSSATRLPDKPEMGYGLGFFVEPYMGQDSFGHSGGMPGVATRIRAFPKDRAGFVLLTNASAYGSPNAADFREEICQRITRVLFPDAPQPPAPEKEKERPPGSPGEFQGKWRGIFAHYDGDVPLSLDVAEDGVIQAGFGSVNPVKLTRSSFANDLLTGQMEAVLNTQPSHHGNVMLEFRLRRDHGSLTGLCVARAEGYLTLSHWIKLEKER
jgi:CubicO group peptidase (beta-lactamase class C family)